MTPNLTRRQRDYLGQLVLGRSVNEIARCEGIEPQAVHETFARARRRLGARHMPHLTAIALSQGLLGAVASAAIEARALAGLRRR